MIEKVAFLALTDSSFNQEELMLRFFCEQHKDKYSLYIHNKNPIANEFFKSHCLPEDGKVETEWGVYSLVLATIKLMEAALKDPNNQRFVLISESHVPLYNIETMCSILINKFSCLSFSNQERERGWANNRFHSLMLNTKRQIFQPKDIRFVSQWFVCNREDAEVFVKNEGKFRKLIDTKKLCFPDELYFHLIGSYLGRPIQYKANCHFNWYLKSSKRMIDLGCREAPKTYERISKNFIDILRNTTDCIFVRKACAETQIDVEYILNGCQTDKQTDR